MEDGATGLRKRPGGPELSGEGPRSRAWSQAPHHRRRRAIAVLVLAALALLPVVLILTAGGTASRAGTAAHNAFFARLRTLAGGGAGSFAATERAAENGAIDRTLAYTPYVRIAGSQHREVALTFDDGPGPYTPAIVSVLERENVPATFFEIGVLERYFHASTSQIVSLGYTIGDHTYSHPPMSTLSPGAQRAELLEQARAVGRYGAPFPRLFRPPYGLWNRATLALLRRYRMLMVLWTVDTGDWRRPGVRAIVNSAVTGARPGAIILLHDAGGDRSQTVAALPMIIRQLRARGYRFVTVPRLLLDNPPPARQEIFKVVGTAG